MRPSEAGFNRLPGEALAESQAKAGNITEPVNTGRDTNKPQKNCYTHIHTRESLRRTHSFCLPTTENSQHQLYNDLALCRNSPSLFLCLLVKTSSLFDHTSKVTANNGALSKPIHAQGMDWQWRISVSRHCRDTQLPPLPTPSVHNQTSAIQRQTNKRRFCFSSKPLFCLHLWHRCFSVRFPNKQHFFYLFTC